MSELLVVPALAHDPVADRLQVLEVLIAAAFAQYKQQNKQHHDLVRDADRARAARTHELNNIRFEVRAINTKRAAIINHPAVAARCCHAAAFSLSQTNTLAGLNADMERCTASRPAKPATPAITDVDLAHEAASRTNKLLGKYLSEKELLEGAVETPTAAPAPKAET